MGSHDAGHALPAGDAGGLLLDFLPQGMDMHHVGLGNHLLHDSAELRIAQHGVAAGSDEPDADAPGFELAGGFVAGLVHPRGGDAHVQPRGRLRRGQPGQGDGRPAVEGVDAGDDVKDAHDTSPSGQRQDG